MTMFFVWKRRCRVWGSRGKNKGDRRNTMLLKIRISLVLAMLGSFCLCPVLASGVSATVSGSSACVYRQPSDSSRCIRVRKGTKVTVNHPSARSLGLGVHPRLGKGQPQGTCRLYSRLGAFAFKSFKTSFLEEEGRRHGMVQRRRRGYEGGTLRLCL